MTEPVTQDEFLRFKRAVIKKFRKLDDLIGDAFVKASTVEEKEDGLVDEALDRATRAQRAVRRVEKALKQHIEDTVDEGD